MTTPGAVSAPAAVAPPPHHPRFPLVDGMRAIAALTVLTVHAAVLSAATGPSLAGRLLAHLNVGVTIFFLISGFLLYRPFIAHRAGGAAAPPVDTYAKRRVLRIYPAWWVVVTVLAIVPGIAVVRAGGWAPMYALLHTFPFGHGARCVDTPLDCGLAQTWSLVVEVTFYVALPAYAWILSRATRRLGLRAWLVAQLGALAVLSLLSVVLRFAVFDPVPWWLTGTVAGYVLWFALGMGMAILSVAARVPAPGPVAALTRRPVLLWLAAAGAYVGFALALPASPFLFARGDQLAEHLVFPGVAALLLAPAVMAAGAGGIVHRVLAHPVMAWLGLVSYGIFLWHYAVTLELGAPGADLPFLAVLALTLLIAVAIAAASYYLIEEPCLRLKYRPLRLAAGRLRRA